jgi:hypothetical protein
MLSVENVVTLDPRVPEQWPFWVFTKIDPDYVVL